MQSEIFFIPGNTTVYSNVHYRTVHLSFQVKILGVNVDVFSTV